MREKQKVIVSFVYRHWGFWSRNECHHCNKLMLSIEFLFCMFVFMWAQTVNVYFLDVVCKCFVVVLQRNECLLHVMFITNLATELSDGRTKKSLLSQKSLGLGKRVKCTNYTANMCATRDRRKSHRLLLVAMNVMQTNFIH